ncbi:MAG TPA: cupin domain-containing protein [Candidatus Limnocylindria bacterium]|nr:cupin domain-containing protein [Candidatus Limnocylindria bacterium]
MSAPPLPEPLRPLAGAPVEPGVAPAERLLRGAGVEPYAWSNAPGDRYGAHDHGYEKLLVCAAGSITFLVGPDEMPVELGAGQGFVLPAGTRHAAIVGPDGCTCLEGHRP